MHQRRLSARWHQQQPTTLTVVQLQINDVLKHMQQPRPRPGGGVAVLRDLQFVIDGARAAGLAAYGTKTTWLTRLMGLGSSQPVTPRRHDSPLSTVLFVSPCDQAATLSEAASWCGSETRVCEVPGLRVRRALRVIPVMQAPAGTYSVVAPASSHVASLASSLEGTAAASSEPAGQQRPHRHSQQASPVKTLGWFWRQGSPIDRGCGCHPCRQDRAVKVKGQLVRTA